jgi:hypothetical protein
MRALKRVIPAIVLLALAACASSTEPDYLTDEQSGVEIEEGHQEEGDASRSGPARAEH